jgi:hypothetical protein
MLVIHGVLFQGPERYTSPALSLVDKKDILDGLGLCSVSSMIGIQSFKGPQTWARSWERKNNEGRRFHPYGTSEWEFKFVKSNW